MNTHNHTHTPLLAGGRRKTDHRGWRGPEITNTRRCAGRHSGSVYQNFVVLKSCHLRYFGTVVPNARSLLVSTQALAWGGWGMWASVGTLKLLRLGKPSACPLRIMLLRRWMMGLLCMPAAVLLRTVRCFPNHLHSTWNGEDSRAILRMCSTLGRQRSWRCMGKVI